MSDLLKQILAAKAALPPPPDFTRIHVTPLAIRTYEDWSRVRSVGRATRRRHRHRQNIRVFQAPWTGIVAGVLYVHDADWIRMAEKAGAALVFNQLDQRSYLHGIPVTFASKEESFAKL